MLTLEEAIKAEEAETLAYEECLNSLDDNMPTDMRNEFNKSLGKQMDYHRQLAEWLKELKRDREVLTELDAAIECYENCECCQGFREYPTDKFVEDLVRILEVNADGKKEDA